VPEFATGTLRPGRKLRQRRAIASVLDQIPGVGVLGGAAARTSLHNTGT